MKKIRRIELEDNNNDNNILKYEINGIILNKLNIDNKNSNFWSDFKNYFIKHKFIVKDIKNNEILSGYSLYFHFVNSIDSITSSDELSMLLLVFNIHPNQLIINKSFNSNRLYYSKLLFLNIFQDKLLLYNTKYMNDSFIHDLLDNYYSLHQFIDKIFEQYDIINKEILYKVCNHIFDLVTNNISNYCLYVLFYNNINMLSNISYQSNESSSYNRFIITIRDQNDNNNNNNLLFDHLQHPKNIFFFTPKVDIIILNYLKENQLTNEIYESFKHYFWSLINQSNYYMNSILIDYTNELLDLIIKDCYIMKYNNTFIDLSIGYHNNIKYISNYLYGKPGLGKSVYVKQFLKVLNTCIFHYFDPLISIIPIFVQLNKPIDSLINEFTNYSDNNDLSINNIINSKLCAINSKTNTIIILIYEELLDINQNDIITNVFPKYINHQLVNLTRTYNNILLLIFFTSNYQLTAITKEFLRNSILFSNMKILHFNDYCDSDIINLCNKRITNQISNLLLSKYSITTNVNRIELSNCFYNLIKNPDIRIISKLIDEICYIISYSIFRHYTSNQWTIDPTISLSDFMSNDNDSLTISITISSNNINYNLTPTLLHTLIFDKSTNYQRLLFYNSDINNILNQSKDLQLVYINNDIMKLLLSYHVSMSSFDLQKVIQYYLMQVYIPAVLILNCINISIDMNNNRMSSIGISTNFIEYLVFDFRYCNSSKNLNINNNKINIRDEIRCKQINNLDKYIFIEIHLIGDKQEIKAMQYQLRNLLEDLPMLSSYGSEKSQLIKNKLLYIIIIKCVDELINDSIISSEIISRASYINSIHEEVIN